MAIDVQETGAAAHATIVAIDMGYGHLRAAHALSDVLGSPVLELDRPPLAAVDEMARWRRVRRAYEALSRLSQLRFARPVRSALHAITDIAPPYPSRDLSRPTLGVRYLDHLVRGGLGRQLDLHLERTGTTLVTTFYAPAIAAAAHGRHRVVLVVTDSDINRVWAPLDARNSSIEYCVPSEWAARRLASYGVRPERIHFTGFPLPPALLGGPGLERLRTDLAARLVRLDPRRAFRNELGGEVEHVLGPLPAGTGAAPRVTFAVGGAGAQAGMARSFLPSLARPIREGRLQLALVAGRRPALAEKFRDWCARAGLSAHVGHGIEILEAASFGEYYTRFNELLRVTDVLWTKPGELTFYGALGLPLVFSRPVGVHERANRKWARLRGAGLKQAAPRYASDWLQEWLDDGTLAAAAWSGFTRLPKFGSWRVAEAVRDVER